jgi:hypothetical protein
MIDARLDKAKNYPAKCLFYTQKLSGEAERSANFVLWDVLLKGTAEGYRDFQTIWVCPRKAKAVFARPLTLYRTCMIGNTIQGTIGMEY